MTAAWAHLLNAKHIDFVLAHVKAHSKEWITAWGAARDIAEAATWDADWNADWNAAWDAAWGAARGAARDATMHAAWRAAVDTSWGALVNATKNTDWGVSAVRGTARDAARSTCVALTLYDDCAHFLSYPPKQLMAAYRLTNDPAALLLLPASFVFQGKYPHTP